jgi:hypothetical protein
MSRFEAVLAVLQIVIKLNVFPLRRWRPGVRVPAGIPFLLSAIFFSQQYGATAGTSLLPDSDKWPGRFAELGC